MTLMLTEATNSGSVVSGIAAIISAVASLGWPLLVFTLVVWKRKQIARLADAAIEIAESSSKVKIWQIEFDRSVKKELASSEAEALRTDPATNVQGKSVVMNFDGAKAVNRLIAEAPTTMVRDDFLDSIRTKMEAFAREYDSTRANMTPGPERTRAMNVVAAKMRTLGLAAVPLLDEFCWDENSPGRRLAGISILEMQPNYRLSSWLCERMSKEQPFLMFHASIAILNMVRYYGSSRADAMKREIEHALEVVQSFKGVPDKNTVDTLELALLELSRVESPARQ